MPPFRYPTLNHPDEIRILVLLAGSGNEPLRGIMRTIRIPAIPSSTENLISHSVWKWGFETGPTDGLSTTITNPYGKEKKFVKSDREVLEYKCNRIKYTSKLEYDALSYTWGDPEKSHQLNIGDASLPITKNLYSAMRHLRRNHDLALWVDAVCIDQEALNERNHQVRMMQRIFSCASSVVVWLGDTHSSAITVERLLLDFNHNLFKAVYGNRADQIKNILSYSESLLAGLRKLFTRPWWSRVWIIQEVVAAREVVVYYGNKTLPWDFFQNICRAIQDNEFRSHPKARFLQSSAARKFTVLDNFRKHKSMPLIRLLQCTRNYNASDPRDKLYALLGMASDVSPVDLAPDYDQPVESVFRGLVQFMMSTQRSLDIITSSRLALATPGTPTWLPDWRITDSLRPLHSEEVAGHLFRASGNSLATASMIGPSGREPVLQVRGAVVDKVDFLGGTCKVSQECLPTIRRWHYIAEQNLDQTVVGVFPLTIIAGKDNMGLKAMPGFVRAYHWFINNTVAPDVPVQFYADAVTRAVTGRRFFTTKRGRMGLGPADVQLGDMLVILEGCNIPLVIRMAGDGVHSLLVGETYTSGIMDGELMDDVVQGKYKRQTVLLK